ncbi:TraB/GumN family protein [Winogradskyella sediminis]|uniref:TraB/GumN family protein n=1 Tax=Winogradskyella sediminis TaxID=1382466 RepID=UPI000E268595|nr:TraB/GumN family protein [Winogradskyella sediminis]REG88152.1 uncharacterized protein YbaP (TraB family) [Winogradskyella sediminis]
MNSPISKKTTRLFSWLFLLFLTPLSYAQNQDAYSLLWKIEGNNLASPSYLFGTMHIDDARVFNFSDAVMPAIESVDYFALEINADSLMTAITERTYTITANDFFKNLLAPRDYRRLLKRFKTINDFSLEDSEIMSPDDVLSMLIPDIDKVDDKSTFVDFYLLGQAQTMNKTIIGLEDIDDQIYYFDRLSDEEKREEILSYLDVDIDSINRTKEIMTTVYATGDLTKIAEFVERNDMIDNSMLSRNKVMKTSIINTMKNGSLFAGIGAAHLVGEGNVIELLQKEGYNVSVVEAKFTGVADTYNIDTSKGYWYNYIDNQLGFQLELPKAPNLKEDFEKFTIHGYGDMTSNTSYLFMGFNTGYTMAEEQGEAFLETMISNILEKRGGEIIERKPLTDKNQHGYDITCKLPDNIAIKARFVVKYNHFYYFSAETPEAQIDENNINRYFESIIIDGIEPPIEDNKGWREFKSEQGAFTVQIPVPAKDMSREQANPLNTEGEPYFLNLYMATDIENQNNYLIRYNDQPMGYFLQNPEIAFKDTENTLLKKSVAVSEPKIIFLNGIEGREYELKLNNKYHCIVRAYIRGNRTYLLLKQRLNETDKVSTDDGFFNSFTLLPYNTPELVDYESPNKDFKIQLFKRVNEDIDTVDLMDSNVKDSYDYTSINSNTGSIYQYGYNNIGKYFRLTSAKTFYDAYKNELLEPNDSIIDDKYMLQNKDSIIQFSVKNELYKNTGQITINRVWYNNYRLHIARAIVTEDEVESGLVEHIFNSIDIKPVTSNIDIYESKAKYIIEDLKSTDSLTYTRAIKSFEYYEFDKDDIVQLKEALNYAFSEETNDEIKANIIHEFSLINEESALDILEAFYKAPSTSDFLKTAILVAIPSITSNKALPLYNTLLFSKAPTEESAYDYSMLQPFRDSLNYTLENYDKLASLMSNMSYRSDLIYLSNDLYNSELDTNDIVTKHYKKLLSHLATDAETFFNLPPPQEGEEDAYDYTYYNLMVAYLNSLNTIKYNDSISDAFTSKLLNQVDDKWLRLLALTARIYNEYTISDNQLNTYLEDMYFRFEIMEAYHKINKLHVIDKKYLTEDAFATLSFYNYAGEDGGFPDNISILKKIEKANSEFYAIKFDYNDDDPDESISYIGIVGPIKTLTQHADFRMYDSNTYWDEYDDDWKTKIDALITDYLEY